MFEIKITVDLSDRALNAFTALTGGRALHPATSINSGTPTDKNEIKELSGMGNADDAKPEETKQRKERKQKDTKPEEKSTEASKSDNEPVTLEKIQAKCLEIVNAEKGPEIKKILSTFKQRKIHELPEENYAEFYKLICAIPLA